MRRRADPGTAALAKLGLRAAGIAHDLAQPLSAALLACRKVSGQGAGQLRESLHRIEDMLAVIRSELADAQPGRGRTGADLAGIGREVLACLAPAERRRVRLRLTGRGAADGLAVRRIVGNLLTNALRHGTGPVKATGWARGGALQITVKGGAARRAPAAGWGIGLASCQDLAKRHRLVLTVTISPQGSTAVLRAKD